MTINEGRFFLQDCLTQCQKGADIDRLIYYRYGTVKHAENYHYDTIVTDVDFKKVPSDIKFIVKCFIHLNIYVAWPQEIGRGNGKFIIYKSRLIEMEEKTESTYEKVEIDKMEYAYIFRGKEGATKFIKENLLLSL